MSPIVTSHGIENVPQEQPFLELVHEDNLELETNQLVQVSERVWPQKEQYSEGQGNEESQRNTSEFQGNFQNE